MISSAAYCILVLFWAVARDTMASYNFLMDTNEPNINPQNNRLITAPQRISVRRCKDFLSSFVSLRILTLVIVIVPFLFWSAVRSEIRTMHHRLFRFGWILFLYLLKWNDIFSIGSGLRTTYIDNFGYDILWQLPLQENWLWLSSEMVKFWWIDTKFRYYIRTTHCMPSSVSACISWFSNRIRFSIIWH